MIRVEQLVYGTFSFTQGFTLVSASEGISAHLAQQAVDVCKAWGEILSPDFRSALYHVPVPRESQGGEAAPDQDEAQADSEAAGGGHMHLVGKVIRQGTDSGDRMAWNHQVLLIPHEDYLRAGADCFAFEAAGFFKDRWFESDRCTALEVEESVLPRLKRGAIPPGHLQLLERIVADLETGAEVRIPAVRITKVLATLFREVLCLLPDDLRARLAVASFAYRPVRRYDLWCLHEAGGPAPERVEDISYRVEPARGRS